MSIKDKLKNLTTSPGIYKFLDKKGKVLYVGKAKNLKSRVKNYFQKSANHGPKNQKLVENTADFEWIETNTEQEAIILETNFIKELRPKYNILMKDDKNFVYIKVTLNEDYPRVMVVRKMEKDGAKYFGPKTSKSSVDKTLKLLTKIFPFRDCNYDIRDVEGSVVVKGVARNLPCLQYHIKKCLGPCIGKVSQEEYRKIIDKIVLFLKGQTAEIEKQIKVEMQEAAAQRKFERAGKLRDNLFAVQNITDKQYISEANFEERDVFGFVQDLGKTFFTLLQIRDGKMIGQEKFIVEGESLDQEGEAQILEAFLEQYYAAATDIPKEILLPIPLGKETPLRGQGGVVSAEVESSKLKVQSNQADVAQESNRKNNKVQVRDIEPAVNTSPNPSLERRGALRAFKQFLSELAGRNVKLLVPQKGKKNALIALAEKNSMSYAKANRLKWMEERTIDYEKLLDELSDVLSVEKKIRRMECYDISHLGGTDTVGSMVVFHNGKPKNSDYRHFKLRSLEEGEIDDFKAMQEVLERRLKYIAFDDKKLLLGDDYKLRKGKKADLEFVEKIVKKEKLDDEDLEVKDFLILEKQALSCKPQAERIEKTAFKKDPLSKGAVSCKDTGGSKPQDMPINSLTTNQADTTQESLRFKSETLNQQQPKEVVGFVRIKTYSEKVKALGTLWVHKKERSKGFATLLCTELIRRSKLSKVYAVTSSDKAPLLFKVGFQEIYDLPKELKDHVKTCEYCQKPDSKYFAYIKSRQEHIDKSFASKPDLIVIDGGKGQLGMAQKALDEFKLKVPLISLAKKEEEIFTSDQKDPIPVEANSEVSFLIQRIRDESHRFAVTFNRELRSKRMVHSKLDEIVGLGPKMKQKLLQRFGSVEGVKNAGDGELIGVVGKGLMQKLRKEL